MKYGLLLRTVRHLTITQAIYQLRGKLSHPKLVYAVAPVLKEVPSISLPIAKAKCYEEGELSFLNVTDRFSSWSQTSHGMLWVYNLNYMDWLSQSGMTVQKCEEWIDRFIEELPQNQVGLDPYPIALRTINWIKLFCVYPQSRNDKRDNSLYSQVLLLEKKLEYRLLGNHLLEDAFALFIASIYFNDERLYRKFSGRLLKLLDEQVLPDGSHYEQSPMYHCILLDRLLDCYNFSSRNPIFEGQTNLTKALGRISKRMLGHLESIVYTDGSIPLLNDSAYGIAPTSEQIFDYARRLDISWGNIPLNECGYRKFANGDLEAVVDVGNVMASYQPGHTHADTFNFELRIRGRPFIVDTGISTYSKTSRRQYERSTKAHNTVVVDGKDSSEVWGGFRVGRRAQVKLIDDNPNSVKASHNGYGRNRLHTRTFILEEDGVVIEDALPKGGVCYLHFAPPVEILSHDVKSIATTMATLSIEGASDVYIEPGEVSTEYNRFEGNKVAKISFEKELKIVIKA